MWKSAPSGPATSLAKYSPIELPVILRSASPMRKPWVTAWYPDAEPGSHHGSLRGEERSHLLPVREVLRLERLGPTGQARCVTHQMTDLHGFFAAGGEFRPVPCDRRS